MLIRIFIELRSDYKSLEQPPNELRLSRSAGASEASGGAVGSSRRLGGTIEPVPPQIQPIIAATCEIRKRSHTTESIQTILFTVRLTPPGMCFTLIVSTIVLMH